MDDISSVNSDGVFEKDISKIYPSSLELTKENDGNTSVDILDLTVEFLNLAISYMIKETNSILVL